MESTKRTRIANDDFVIAYATATYLEDVVKSTGMTLQGVKNRASMLARKGVKLPRLRKRPGGGIGRIRNHAA